MAHNTTRPPLLTPVLTALRGEDDPATIRARTTSLRLPDLPRGLFWDVNSSAPNRQIALVQVATADHPETRLEVTLAREDSTRETGVAYVHNTTDPLWPNVGRDLLDALAEFIEAANLDGPGNEVRLPKNVPAAGRVDDQEPLRFGYVDPSTVTVQGESVFLLPDPTRFRLLRPVFQVWMEQAMTQAFFQSRGVPLGVTQDEQAEADRQALEAMGLGAEARERGQFRV